MAGVKCLEREPVWMHFRSNPSHTEFAIQSIFKLSGIKCFVATTAGHFWFVLKTQASAKQSQDSLCLWILHIEIT